MDDIVQIPVVKTKNENVSEIDSRTKNKPLIIAAISLAAILFLVIGTYLFYNQKKTTSKLGVVLSYVEGEVEYQKNNNGWKTAPSELSLSEGNMVRVLSSGRAILNFDDGSSVRLKANTIVVLEDLSPGHVVVVNNKGEVYARISKSSKREFLVKTPNASYQAMGTAFKTANDESKQGVEVYESQVKVLGINNQNELLVSEGSQYYLVNADKPNLANAVSVIDINEVKKDEFIVWNKEEDKKNSENVDPVTPTVTQVPENTPKPTEKNEPSPTQKPTAKPTLKPINAENGEGKLILSAVKTDEGVYLKWVVSGMDSNLGFKIVKSTESNPVYPGNDYQYLETPSIREYTWKIKDGNTYHFRVCKYTGSGCSVYSNDVSVKTPTGEESGDSGSVSSISLKSEGGARVSWTLSGYSSKGFKVVWSKNSSPVYPNRDGDQYHYYSEASKRDDNVDAFSGSGKYYVRVCEYLGGVCGVYSNQIEVNL